MRKFILTSPYQYNEIQAVEQYTGKLFTLTQKTTLFTGNYYTVYRFIAVDNEYNNTPEPDSYVYQFNYMSNGSTLNCIVVDEKTAENFIHANTLSLMRDEVNTKDFQEYFEKSLTN